jgi:hypothetical protein
MHNFLRRGASGRLVVFGILALILGAATLAVAGSHLGRLYLVTRQATISSRAGIPCVPGREGENVSEFCDQVYECPEGQVARGVLMDVDDVDGQSVLNGIGVMCREPNEIYQSREVGAFGESHSGKTYRDPCDIGFNLVGVNALTTDQRNVSGLSKVCRRYWPVEQRNGPNSFGSGAHSEYVGCAEGNFVTGLKVSYLQEKKADGSLTRYLRNFRFFCAEMRHWVSEPDDVRDPRDPEIRK